MVGRIITPEWLIISAKESPVQHWGIRVIEDKIDDIAPNDALVESYPNDDVWDGRGMVLSPGFVNTHSHLYGVLAHGIPLAKAPSGFWAFLEEFWWPLVENRLDHAMINAATDLRCANMLRSGVTSFYDCTEAPYALPGCLASQAEVVKKWGLRAILSFEATERVSSENGILGLMENLEFVRACKREGENISGLICHHTTFTCSEQFIRQAFEMAVTEDVALHAHVSEGTYEPEYALRNFGKRTLEYYDEIGIAGDRFLASQCVQLSQDEIALAADRGIRISHMPLSNCEVGGGIAPVPDLLAEGVQVGLGSDGYIDDFYEVMRGAFLIHKAARQDPRVMPAHDVWFMATEGGAKVLGFNKVGRIERGWQADVQLISADLPTSLEAHNLYDQLLLYRNENDVRGVLVAGKVKVDKGEVIDADWERLHAQTREASQRLWSLARD